MEGALDGSNSVPSPLDRDTEMEIGQDGMGDPGMEDPGMDTDSARPSYMRASSAAEVSSRPPISKARLSGSYSLPPTVIEEPAMEEGDTTSSSSAKSNSVRLQRSPSPSLQIPSSPVRIISSPSASPRSLRKTRMAHTRRRGSRGKSAPTTTIHVSYTMSTHARVLYMYVIAGTIEFRYSDHFLFVVILLSNIFCT